MVRLPLTSRLSSHLSSKNPTPGQSRTPSPSRILEKPLVLKVAVLKVRGTDGLPVSCEAALANCYYICDADFTTLASEN